MYECELKGWACIGASYKGACLLSDFGSGCTVKKDLVLPDGLLVDLSVSRSER